MNRHQYRETPHPAVTTFHARVRCQQRGIPGQLLDLLLDHGKERHLGHGATILSFPKQVRYRLRERLGQKAFAQVADRLDIYAIVGDGGQVVTVGHRFRPIHDKH